MSNNTPDNGANPEKGDRSTAPSRRSFLIGAASAMDMAIQVARPGGTIGYVGVPHGVAEEGLDIMGLFFDNLTLRGGPAPVRAYMAELMEDVLDGTLDPSPVFDMTVDLDSVPDGYQAMDDREAIKVFVKV